jgi:hypothetical protein
LSSANFAVSVPRRFFVERLGEKGSLLRVLLDGSSVGRFGRVDFGFEFGEFGVLSFLLCFEFCTSLLRSLSLIENNKTLPSVHEIC